MALLMALMFALPATTVEAQSGANAATESDSAPVEFSAERDAVASNEGANGAPLTSPEPSRSTGVPDESQLRFADAPEEADDPPPLIGPGDIIRMLLVLGVVVAAIYGLFILLRRLSARQRQSSDSFRLHGSLSLTNNGSLHIVEVGSHLYLLGCGDQGVSLISEITDEASQEQIKKISREAGGTPKRSFRQQLFNLLPSASIKKRGATSTTTMFSNPFQVLRAAQSRLQNLHRESNSYKRQS